MVETSRKRIISSLGVKTSSIEEMLIELAIRNSQKKTLRQSKWSKLKYGKKEGRKEGKVGLQFETRVQGKIMGDKLEKQHEYALENYRKQS